MKALLGIVLGGAVSLAQAQTCPTDAPISTVMAAGFSCQVGDKTFSAFDITGAPVDARIQFGLLNGELFAVTLSRDGAFFSDGRTVFDYTISAAAPNHIVQGTVGVDVSFPSVITTTTLNGTLLGPVVNGGTEMMLFAPGTTSVVVDNTSTISGAAELNSISNDFTQVQVGVAEFGSRLAANGLLALGVGVAWLTGRRRK
jgi:hypothetical protein